MWQEAGTADLLDWLDVPKPRRFVRESALDADDQATLRGLVLLDLPDFDSIEAAHRAEVDRLLRLVDLVIWVTDPQKYADQVIHEQYLQMFHRQAPNMVVVLNQADRLPDADVTRCLTDLRRLLDADGLGACRCWPPPPLVRAREWSGCAAPWNGPSPNGSRRCAASARTWTERSTI